MRLRDINTENIPHRRDPHHDGFTEWCLYLGDFWQKPLHSSTWTKVKKSHITVKRIKMLHEMIMEKEQGEGNE